MDRVIPDLERLYTCLLFCTIHRFNDSGENAPVLLSLSYWYNSMRKRLNIAARDTMRRHSIMIDQYLNEISHLIAHITKKEKDSMRSEEHTSELQSLSLHDALPISASFFVRSTDLTTVEKTLQFCYRFRTGIIACEND